MTMVTANSCAMYYKVDDFTDPWLSEKETVWLQHGVGRSTKFWYHWVPALARHYRVIRRDMRGHGQSADPGPDHTWSIDELAAGGGVNPWSWTPRWRRIGPGRRDISSPVSPTE